MEKIDYKIKKVKEKYVNKKWKIKTKNVVENYTETNMYFYHKNHLNSIVAITDNSGNIVEEYEYDVFWKPYSINQKTWKITNLKKSVIWNTRLFTWREYERWLQLYYNRARYYNPLLARFISRDPIDISDDVNLYGYVGNSPVMFVDPMGTEKKIINPPKTAAEHYARNILNVDLPETEIDAIKNWWRLLSQSESVWHSYNIPVFEFNSKYISKDWHREAVYHYKTWKIVMEAENMWTYNYYDPISEPWLHYKYDVKPYFDYWNSENDTTNIAERYLKSSKIIPAEINDKKAKIKYEINTFDRIDFINSFINYWIYK